MAGWRLIGSSFPWPLGQLHSTSLECIGCTLLRTVVTVVLALWLGLATTDLGFLLYLVVEDAVLGKSHFFLDVVDFLHLRTCFTFVLEGSDCSRIVKDTLRERDGDIGRKRAMGICWKAGKTFALTRHWKARVLCLHYSVLSICSTLCSQRSESRCVGICPSWRRLRKT